MSTATTKAQEWHLQREDNGRYFIDTYGGQLIKTVVARCGYNAEDARLIAAAPDLLAALLAVMAEADFGDTALAEKCRAAIAKARGDK